ncbi:secretion/DNA translocation related CpaE-like protein [Rhodococcus sp. SMB37]|uniref:septum site-determining protein Ssd n=1 Tax=Rhodococcus sp. SMB37 TaxID=2512213 RepID=UPI00104F8E97|nr:septum site-determining protein Ssd [Rhodococcus sp. SMB37]TCN48950.1 secretion/DNA translocation related CpaE-like protein [Rhodococcus sp. SMB37]
MNDVLALIGDATLLASLRRVAAAADRQLAEPTVLPRRRAWLDAGLVVVDRDEALSCAAALPRRSGIVLVCPGAPGLDEWQAAATVGAEHVLGLPDDEVELLAVLGAAAEPEAGGGTVFAVVGGCGGAGASTFAAALAWAAAARGAPGVLLVDADPFGAGLDTLTGLEERAGIRWSGLTVDSGSVSARALRDAVPEWLSGVGVLAGDRGAERIGAAPLTAVLEAARRAGVAVVCDVARTFDEVAEAAIAAADTTVLVTQARVSGALAAARTADWLTGRAATAGVVVRGPAPGGLRAADVAAVVGLPLLAAMRPQPGLAEALERGGLRLRQRSPLVVAAFEVFDSSAHAGPRGAA